jgi:DNA-binding transcriptional MerR regulator
MKSEPSNQGIEPTYRSGTAARLAGIPVDTLRMWERRYQVVGPQVSARGHRRYAAIDVDRLALIKGLVDLGHSIGTIAHLPYGKLQELRAALVTLPSATQPRARESSVMRVAIVGEALAARAVAVASRFPRLQIVGTGTDREHAAGALRDVAADLLAIELPALRKDAVEFVDALAAATGARRAVVSYRFGTEAAVRELRRRGHAVARAPIDLAQIESLGAALPGAPEAAANPRVTAPGAPRFDERALAQLAQISTTVRCECPHHVVDLLLSLRAFERYSAECENRSPADAELHRYLGRVTGNVRALFEEALVRVAQAQGIPLPPADA